MVGSWSRQSFVSRLIVSSVRSGLACAYVLMNRYSIFFSTTSSALATAQVITCPDHRARLVGHARSRVTRSKLHRCLLISSKSSQR